jgi:hypothetical protein
MERENKEKGKKTKKKEKINEDEKRKNLLRNCSFLYSLHLRDVKKISSLRNIVASS